LFDSKSTYSTEKLIVGQTENTHTYTHTSTLSKLKYHYAIRREGAGEKIKRRNRNLTIRNHLKAIGNKKTSLLIAQTVMLLHKVMGRYSTLTSLQSPHKAFWFQPEYVHMNNRP